MPTTSIDELLSEHINAPAPSPVPTSQKEPETFAPDNTTTPQTPEQKDLDIEDNHTDTGDYEIEEKKEEPQDEEGVESKKEDRHVDEYGNEDDPQNKAVRERLSKQAQKYEQRIAQLEAQLNNRPNQDNEAYQPDNGSDANLEPWQIELKNYIRKELGQFQTQQVRERQIHQERIIQQDFESRFHAGMGKFDDFSEVVSQMPFTDDMVKATRAFKDPASFLYAASKRFPQEIERISKISDPYAQTVEIGKLEERMKKKSAPSSAPKPLDRTREDITNTPKETKKKELTGDDLLMKADSNRRNMLNQRRR